MLVMALSGAAVLALVCWAALRESPPAVDDVIPQRRADSHDGGVAESAPSPLAGVPDAQHGELDDATVADADTEEALAAAAALWSVLTQDRG